VYCLAIRPDGRMLAAGTLDVENPRAPATAHLWDLADGKPVGQPLAHKGGVTAVVFAPDGQSVLTASWDGTTQLWEAATGKPVGLPMRHPRGVLAARLTPDGRTIVTGGEDGIVRWWDLATGYPLIGTLPVQRGVILDLALSSDGRTLAVVSHLEGKSGAAHVWELARPLSRPPGKGKEADLKAPWVIHDQTTWMFRQGVAYSPDPLRVATGTTGGCARLESSATGRPLVPPLRHSFQLVFVLALSPDGRLLATSSQDRTAVGDARLWDAATGRPIGPPLPHLNWVSALAFAPHGKLLASGSYDWALRFWDPATGKQLGPHLSQGGVVQSLAFSPDGRTLAVGRARTSDVPAAVLLWSLAPPPYGDGPPARPIGRPMPGPNVILQFSPDGKRLLSAAAEVFQLWDPATGEPASPPLSEASEVNAVAFSPDGRSILTGSTDGTARLWDVDSSKPLGAPMLHAQRLTVVAFTPDPGGRLILTGCADGSARLWDHATHKPIGPPVLQGRGIRAATFLPDGRSFVTTAEDGTTRCWPVPLPAGEDFDLLALRLQVRTGLHMGPGQTVARLSREEWEKCRRELVAREGSADGACAGSVSDRDYHDARARDAEQDGAPFAVRWHLDRLIAAQADPHSEGWLAYARRGSALSRAGLLDQAGEDYQRALALSSPEELDCWYRHRIGSCLAASQWRPALWYLERVLARAPKDWRLYADRALVWGKLGKEPERAADLDRAIELGADGVFLARLADECAGRGEWDRAARAAVRASECGPAPHWAWRNLALGCLHSGDRAAYCKVCAAALGEVSPPPNLHMANLVAWVCALGPEGVADYRRPLALAELAVSHSRPDEKHGALNTLGALLYRAGRWREAVERLREAIQGGQGGAADWVFLAMAHHRLGEATEARQFLARVTQAKPQGGPWDRLELDLLRREAETLVEGPGEDSK
jgi:WD40 repeat protein/tetratricopeptide (TPR) repeat protein